MLSIVSAIVVLGILIFVHELGHFLLAKLMGVGVEKFSLGFGPKVVGFRRGETEYLLSAVPLGGYVKMVGESPDGELSEEDEARSFAHKSPLRRMAIVAAGPVFNLLFAYLLFILVYMIGVPSITTRIGEVVMGMPAAKAGLQNNDLVLTINGRPVSRWDELASTIHDSGGRPQELTVRRGGSTITVRVVPESQRSSNLFGESVAASFIGVKPAGEQVVDRYAPGAAFVKGSVQTWRVMELTVVSLVKIVQRVVPLDTIGGPIMIAKMAAQQVEAGLVSFLAFMALLSINLGILNLLPIPILDGGHLVFAFWELVTRRPVEMKTRELAQQVGLVLLVGLMVLAFYNDIARYVLGQG